MQNLPDTTFQADPKAPWNAPDPWEGKSCDECLNRCPCKMLDGSERTICTLGGYDDVYEIDPESPACECFEE